MKLPPARFLSVPTLLVGLVCPAFAALPAPTDLEMAFPWNNATTVQLAWTDNAIGEDAYEFELYIGPTDQPPVYTGTTDFKGETITGLNGGSPAQTISFRVRTLSAASGDSEWTAIVSGTTPSSYAVAIQSSFFGGGTVGVPVSTVTFNFLPPTAIPSALGLPAGLTVTSTTAPGATVGSATITGTATEAGLFRAKVGISDGIDTASTYALFRILPAPSGPTALQPLAPLDLPASPVAVNFNLAPHFSDPDTACAARIDTNHGPIDVILYNKATPASVENFLDYATPNHYANALFHRSATTASSGVAVIQAGWFKPEAGGNYVSIPTQTSVKNEPGIPNARGTLAIAKLGGAANSGTSQWYFNVVDNAGLNSSSNNGGFAVFGRAATPSLPVMDALFALPRATYSITLDAAARSVTEFPTNQVPAGALPAPGDLVLVTGVRKLDHLLRYAISANSAPALVTAEIVESRLRLTPQSPVLGGDATINLIVTDLDGNALPASIDVHIRQSFAVWAVANALSEGNNAPNDDGEHDGMANTLEYALLANPQLPDMATYIPTGKTIEVEASRYLALTFSHRLFANDLNYLVEKSDGLTGWTTIWKTSDSFEHANVFEAVEAAGKTIVTVRDPAPITPGSQAHLRLRVDLSVPQPN